MIECVFTIDYEIYGNGEGSLKDLVYEPMQKLMDMFNREELKLVVFVETAELQKIEEAKSDLAIYDVTNQIKDLYKEGHEIALHLHPQWYRGNFKNNKWELDNSEYNLCILPEKRIAEIVDRSINYLRSILHGSNYTPMSFRAGNWLFQPTQPAAKILSSKGIKIDSSVFKGGLQHQIGLDYRHALKNRYFWKFQDDVNIATSKGKLMEIPIYSEMVPPWRMATKKRLGLQATAKENLKNKINRILNLARPFQPLKLDFCRMTIGELTCMMDRIIKDDRDTPNVYKPIATIGHTKDLVDFKTVELFFDYLKQNSVKVSTFQEVYGKAINYY